MSNHNPQATAARDHHKALIKQDLKARQWANMEDTLTLDADEWRDMVEGEESNGRLSLEQVREMVCWKKP